MSARLLRKVLQQQQRSPELDAESVAAEGDDDPNSPVSSAPYRNPFDLLVDEEKNEQEVDGVGCINLEVEQNCSMVKNFPREISSITHKSKKKKKKRHNIASFKKKEDSFDVILEDLSLTSEIQNSFEMSKSLKSEDHLCSVKQSVLTVLSLDPKFLKAENELRKIFGSKVVKAENSRIAGTSRQMYSGKRTALNPRNKILISPPDYWPKWDGSLSMELLETKGGMHYFRYVYSQSYTHIQGLFEDAKASNDLNAIASILAYQPYHVEALLTFAEVFKFSGEHQSSADAIEKCLFALECAWHPLFNPIHGNCQLSYRHDANKPIFTALVNHMKNMDRRGCHRSALEVCKLLLSLDSDDPVGALFFIDYFSVRAQEYTWLEQFSNDYKSDNSLWLFPNFSYSLAICRFYLERDVTSKEADRNDMASSNDLMKQALLLHPLVLKKMVSKAPMKDPAWIHIFENSFFSAAHAGSPTLDHLIDIYVERNYILWRFPELQNFVKEVALHVVESLICNGNEAKNCACVRKEAFSSERNEYSHLLISDFSDTIPSIPPEEVRRFMVGQHMANGVADVERRANPARAQEVREVVGRNPTIVFLESLLPWVDYGANDGDHRENPENDN